MFAYTTEKGVKFLVRAKDLYTKMLPGNGLPAEQEEFDINITRILTRSNSKKMCSHPETPKIYRYIDRNTKFDPMDPGSSDEYILTLRVVRIKIADGVYENLITNVHTFPRQKETEPPIARTTLLTPAS